MNVSRKKLTPQTLLGQRGANLVERIVLEMRSVWRPILLFDLGIDGEIEICDPQTGEATNLILRVQVKATGQAFQRETADSFEYVCDRRDVDYWLQGNAPVVLILCRPDTNEAYWISVKDYFNDPASLRTSRISFSKQRNKFDSSCASTLKELALPKDSGIYFSPFPQTEKLYSNLLKVSSFASDLYLADTSHRKPEDVWAAFKTTGVNAGSEWVLSGKKIISFRDLHESPFSGICDLGTCERFSTREWAYSQDGDRQRDFVRLLNLCLKERARLLGLWLFKDGKRRYFYFPATRSLKPRRVQYQSKTKRVSREVFKQYSRKSDPSQPTYCRHLAFKGYFIRLMDEWYLEITPTYHFTSNGKDEDKFRAERLQGIKRLERNPAVFGQVLFWADYLRRQTRGLFSSEYPLLTFDNLAALEIQASVPDEIWYQGEEGTERDSMQATDNQLHLIGL